MCRSESDGCARRCNKDNNYGKQVRNLQAQKQYHAKKGNTKKVEEISKVMNSLREEKNALIADGGKLLPYTMTLTPNAQAVMNHLRSSGFQPYIVGGSVRDALMGLDSKDVDIEVYGAGPDEVVKALKKIGKVNEGSAPFEGAVVRVDENTELYLTREAVLEALEDSYGKETGSLEFDGKPIEVSRAALQQSLKKNVSVDEVGKSFGVLKIAIDGEDFDVSLPRRDSKVGDGHKGFTVEVDSDMTLMEATARRDFTINALMYDDKTGHIIDKHNGLDDLKNGYLRHVSDAFDEDPLRVLRGVQMASRFNMQLHPDTITKAETLKDQFNALAVERVQVEFEKLYTKGKAPHKAIQLLQDTGWDKNFAGLSSVNLKDMKRDLKKTQHLIDKGTIPKDKSQLVLSSVIASKMNDADAREFLRYTTIGDTMKNGAYNLSRLELPTKQGKAALRLWAKNMPNKLSINDWAMLAEAKGDEKKAARIREKAAKLGILHESEPDIINGNDLMALHEGSKPGKWLKPALEAARLAQYSDTFRNKEDGLAWAAKNTKAE
jgi:tRNA nucleotidyltransferase/poly(A) polymerase